MTTAQLTEEYASARLSEGTLITEDIFSEIEHLLPVCMVNDFWKAAVGSEERGWLYDEAYDYLEEAAPEGCYFGTDPGEGACIGFWLLPEVQN